MGLRHIDIQKLTSPNFPVTHLSVIREKTGPGHTIVTFISVEISSVRKHSKYPYKARQTNSELQT